MAQSRRDFMRTLGIGSAGALAIPALPSWASARGLEAASAEPLDVAWQQQPDVLRLESNENPNGPVPAAIRAMQANFKRAAWYPASGERTLREAIARVNSLEPDQVMLGSGSGEILRLAVQAFCSPTKHLVTAVPTFEAPTSFARTLGYPVKEVGLTSDLALDTQRMLAEVRGAGLVFFCNPNNPTGHVIGKAQAESFVRAVLAADPEVVVLVDEAYHEFVDHPDYASMLPLCSSNPRVFISRTFSKIYGLAGMRVGYAFGQPATLAKMDRFRLSNGIGALAQVAAIAALEDPAQMRREQELNREARAFTAQWFSDKGYTVVPSAANFVLVDIRRDSRAFRDACRAQGVGVGRPFPPLTNYTRVSIGTMAEMRRATDVFSRVLAG